MNMNMNMDVVARNDETTDDQMAAEDDTATDAAAAANGVCAEQEGPKAGVDWASMLQNEPGCTEIPLFLNACDKHEAASDKFAQGLDGKFVL